MRFLRHRLDFRSNNPGVVILRIRGDVQMVEELKTKVFPLIRRIFEDAKARERGEAPKKKPCGCGGE
ncbi:MAG: hypothetical protein JST51_11655 [Armatimonadetes bacterium]|nr:hypothetical protein [Armatimonadota bacterium]